MTKHDQIKKEWIKIDSGTMNHILHWSGLDIRPIRVGNRFNSARKYSIYDKYRSKHYWDVVIYSYSVADESETVFLNKRYLEVSEIYLNPKYAYLAQKGR